MVAACLKYPLLGKTMLHVFSVKDLWDKETWSPCRSYSDMPFSCTGRVSADGAKVHVLSKPPMGTTDDYEMMTMSIAHDAVEMVLAGPLVSGFFAVCDSGLVLHTRRHGLAVVDLTAGPAGPAVPAGPPSKMSGPAVRVVRVFDVQQQDRLCGFTLFSEARAVCLYNMVPLWASAVLVSNL
jgi:hypothetical protein